MPDILLVLFVVSLLPIVLAGVAIRFRVAELGKFDNHNPRAQQAALTGMGSRVVAAQKNAWEALLVFAVVTLIAVASQVDLDSLKVPAYLFLVARILHPIFYVTNLAMPRSLAFAIGWFSCVYIFWQAYSAFGSV